MKILCFKTKKDVEMFAASIVIKAVQANPRIVLGLATGRTMIGVYSEMVSLARKSPTTFREVKTFNLDEYVGLPPHHPASFQHFMHEHLFSHLNFNLAYCSLPRGFSPHPAAEAIRYENEIEQKGGIDLQLLGLGVNAHIGFNEPGSSFDSKTRVVKLTQETKDQNKFAFPNESIPEEAISMGLSTIMKCQKILLIVTGLSKARPLADSLEAVQVAFPASILKNHSDVTVLADEEAVSLIPEAKRQLITRAN
jgi:glucosamine-6-phosphate deaminase